MRKFRLLAASSLGTVGLKLLLSTILVLIGFNLSGAIFGALLATLIANPLVFMAIRNHCSGSPGRLGVTSTVANLETPPFLPVLIATLSLAIITHADVVVANHFFVASDAGRFAGIAVLGKASLYVNLGLVTTLFPKMAVQSFNAHARMQLIQAVGLLVACCSLFSSLLYFFAEDILTLFFGNRFEGGGNSLFLYSLAMIPTSVLTLISQSLIALGKHSMSGVLLLFSFVLVGALVTFHQSTSSIILITGSCSLGCVAVLLLFNKNFLLSVSLNSEN